MVRSTQVEKAFHAGTEDGDVRMTGVNERFSLENALLQISHRIYSTSGLVE
jgi:hypothetical protein